MGLPSTKADVASAGPRVGIADRARRDVAARSLAVEVATVAGLTGVAAASYVWTKAPLYNPGWTIDPWLYTALWTNFNQIFHAFSITYYASRLPWIVPGYLANKLFSERAAFLVVHSIFFLGGGVLLYVLCRRYLGRVAAACGYIALIGSGLYFSAHRWDYVDGAVITFLIASVAFAVPKHRGPVIRPLSLGLSGLFSAALVTTRLVDAAYLVGILPLYWAVMLDPDRSKRWRSAGFDAAAFIVGAAVLLILCGVFNHRHGAEFLFFMPQVRIVLSTSGAANQVPLGQWFPTDPYFLMPLFVIAVALLVLICGRPADRIARRFLIAASVWTAFMFAAMALWEFVGSGWVFDYAYYFNSFLPPTILCLAGCVRGLIEPAEAHRVTWWWRTGVVFVATAGVLAPLIWIYRSDSHTRTATAVFHGPYLETLIVMGAALCATALALTRRSTALGIVAIALAFLGISQAADASNATYLNVASDPRAGPEYRLGEQLLHYLRDEGYQTQLPYFWFRDSAQNYTYRGLQSLYFSGFTSVATDMPVVDQTFRVRMRAFAPKTLVLLCSESSCSGAGTALTRAGYHSKEVARRLLAEGGVHVWVVIRSVTPPTGA